MGRGITHMTKTFVKRTILSLQCGDYYASVNGGHCCTALQRHNSHATFTFCRFSSMDT